MMSLKLWQLAALALPMIVILLVQTVVMFLYANFVVFNVMGRDYEAAAMTTAFCGFGMGARDSRAVFRNAQFVRPSCCGCGDAHECGGSARRFGAL